MKNINWEFLVAWLAISIGVYWFWKSVLIYIL